MTKKLSERLRDGAASLAENWGFADHAALHSEAAATIEAQAARIEVLERALRRIEHEAIIRKPENAAQTVDDLRALARAALGGNHDPR